MTPVVSQSTVPSSRPLPADFLSVGPDPEENMPQIWGLFKADTCILPLLTVAAGGCGRRGQEMIAVRYRNWCCKTPTQRNSWTLHSSSRAAGLPSGLRQGAFEGGGTPVPPSGLKPPPHPDLALIRKPVGKPRSGFDPRGMRRCQRGAPQPCPEALLLPCVCLDCCMASVAAAAAAAACSHARPLPSPPPLTPVCLFPSRRCGQVLSLCR